MLPELLCVLGIQGIDKALKTQSGKCNANEWGMYRDGNGDYRLIKNGKKVVDTYDSNGDYVIKYVNNGSIVVNITKEEANRREEEAIKNNKRFYLRQKNNGWKNRLGPADINGDRYCEVGKPYAYYVKKSICYKLPNGKSYFGEFYMDMKCKLICPTEEQVESDIKLFKESEKVYGLISEDNSDLYDTIIKEWDKYAASKCVNVKYNEVHNLGYTNKYTYRQYTEQINRWN